MNQPLYKETFKRNIPPDDASVLIHHFNSYKQNCKSKLRGIKKKEGQHRKKGATCTLHFGALVNGGRAESLNVDDVPDLVRHKMEEAAINEVSSVDWDVCTVEYYGYGRYNAGVARAGNGTDFESSICLICLEGIVDLAFGKPEEIKVLHGIEGCFSGSYNITLASSQIMLFDWDTHTPGFLMAISANSIPTILVTLRRLRTSVRLGMKLKSIELDEDLKTTSESTPLNLEHSGSLLSGDHDVLKVPSIENEHVRAVYDTIATHWSSTRYKPWPKVVQFLTDNCMRGDLIGDLGCGNGKYMKCCPTGTVMIGSDSSPNLLSVCAEKIGKAAELCVADVVCLPFRDNSFDAAICIAVLHHLSTELRRTEALKEMVRVIKPGAALLVYGWAQEQEEKSSRRFSHQDMLVPWHFSDRMRTISTTKKEQDLPVFDLESSDMSSVGSKMEPIHGYRAEGKHSTVFQRYCHLFKEGEIEKIFKKVGGCLVIDSYYDCSNWCVIVRKM